MARSIGGPASAPDSLLDAVLPMNPFTESRLTQAAPASGAPKPWLVADIGGTNARFGFIGATGTGLRHHATLAVADFESPATAARAYLERVAAALGAEYSRPRAAALAVATAVLADRIELTNSSWSFSCQELQRELGLVQLRVVNDFEALALALPRLQASQVRPVGPVGPLIGGDSAPGAMRGLVMAVIGPGTGLGVAGIVRTAAGAVALPGEGGHVSLAAADDFESELLAVVRRRHRHVSAERLLSGMGLPVLHDAMAIVLGQGAASLSTHEIVERARAGGDALAGQTLDQFCAFLGGFAGNVALTLGARGGVFIGGGIVPRLGERFFGSRFRERFEAKGRFESYLAAIPTALITDVLAALGGAAVALE